VSDERDAEPERKFLGFIPYGVLADAVAACVLLKWIWEYLTK
jgi:hypothetical protein